MACDEYRPFVGAYIDGEFEEREEAEFEAHVASCESCRRELEEHMGIKELVRESAEVPEAPDALRDSIEAELAELQADTEVDSSDSGFRRRALTSVAAIVPVALGLGLVLWLLPSMTVAPVSSGQLPVVEQTIDWHRQDLPIEVQGPERNKVADWFRGKVQFPVRVPAFTQPNVELNGGRIAHVGDRRAAYLTYDVGGRKMSVMIFQADNWNVPTQDIREIGDHDVALVDDNGYEMAILQDGGLTYTMTSDLQEEELVDLVSSSLGQSGQ